MLVIRWKGWILKAIPHHIWPFQLDSNSKRWSAGKGKKQVLKKYIYKKKKRKKKGVLNSAKKLGWILS